LHTIICTNGFFFVILHKLKQEEYYKEYMKTEKQIAACAAAFAERWKGRGYEKGDSQVFWTELLTEVYGVENPSTFIRFEEQVKIDNTNFIDVHIPSTKVIIEQKSIGKDLRKGIAQSDGSVLNPFQQAKRYSAELAYSDRPRWIVTCNFAEFLVYDMEQPNGEPEQILLENLGKEYYRLQFLVDVKNEHISKEMEVSMQAGEIVGKIYEALLKQYDDNSPEALRWLNILCVRIVFCLYAEDAGVFTHDQFHDYLTRYEADDLRNALIRLFEVLNTPTEKRSKYLKDDLKAFPYTNGGLFEEEIEIPQFTEELKETLLQNASLDFDWSEISPTIFGAVFESTLNPETRRSGGMHYTSIENIHKVIDPLFLNDLRRELDEILEEKVEKQRQRKLSEYQMKLSSLTFLDPACGSGNFLTETYLSLRRLENEVIREMYHGQTMMGAFVNPIKVSIQQFYGIEINDFAVTVATTALWISEAQMMAETERIVHQDIDFLPLKPYHNIREGNALRMDWDVIEYPSDIPTIYAKNAHVIYEDEAKWIAGEPVVEFDDVNVVAGNYQRGFKSNAKRYEVKYDYIIGNPPFVGYAYQTKEQKEDLRVLMKGFGNNIDYVAGWYYKASQIIRNTNTRCALVSTNSITQGEQVAAIWKPMFEKFGIHFDFAYRTFRWDSEATLKAHVHCVIIGFSSCDSQREKRIYLNDNQIIHADNINGYLLNAPTIFIEKNSKPLCDVPPMIRGSSPIDDGNLLMTIDEKEEYLKNEPQGEKFLRPFMMGKDFIERKPRWCFWLVGANPSEIKACPILMKRINAVREFRLSSSKAATVQSAETPTLFGEMRPCESEYIAIPKVSSERRRYIPIEYLKADILAGDKLFQMPHASLYHFGVLTSNVHMGWMRAVCGRLEMRYSYSNTIVYNNFPWPNPTEAQRQKIEQTAQAILDARALYPDVTLADLYDDITLIPALLKAHQQNDRAVMEAYGFPVKSTFTESQCVAELFKLYQTLIK
jgi:type I restriction-modification system DNA methylase subunit